MRLNCVWLGLVIPFTASALAQNVSAGTKPSPSDAGSNQAVAASSTQGSSDTGDVADLLAPGPLPNNPRLSLIAGSVVHLDRIRNRMEVKAFGGQRMRVDFDERSRIFRNGVETTSLGINQGDRVYLDTMLNGAHVFAKTIHVETSLAQADAEGQVLSVNQSKKTFTVRDKVSDQPVTIGLATRSKILNQGTVGSLANLEPGALVRVHFVERGAARPEADSVYIFAAPGTAYTFIGEVTYIDKSQNLIAIRSAAGDRSYDIYAGAGVPADLHVGATARVTAKFDGDRYVARSISVEQASKENPQLNPQNSQSPGLEQIPSK